MDTQRLKAYIAQVRANHARTAILPDGVTPHHAECLIELDARLAALEAKATPAPDHTEGGKYVLLHAGTIAQGGDQWLSIEIAGDTWTPIPGHKYNVPVPKGTDLYRRPVAPAQPSAEGARNIEMESAWGAITRAAPKPLFKGIIAPLWQHIDALARERDEARAEVERLNNTLSMVRGVAKSYEIESTAKDTEITRLQSELAAACAQVEAARQTATEARSHTDAIRAQFAAAREQGREEIRKGIAELIEMQAEHYKRNAANPAMLRKEFNEFAHDNCLVLARFARNWKPAAQEGGAK